MEHDEKYSTSKGIPYWPWFVAALLAGAAGCLFPDAVTRDKVAQNGDATKSIISARKFRVQANLIAQGVPVAVAKRLS